MTTPPSDKLRVLIMSQREAEAHQPGASEACISITSPGQPWANVSSRFRAVLRLAFHDLAGFEREDGSYPDGGVQLSADDAARIAEFVHAHRHVERIVVQCQAGVSRSVAVGLAISTTLSRYWAWPPYMPAEYRRNRFRHGVRGARCRGGPMIPVDQDRFGRGEGNCWAAAIATLTGLPLVQLTTELGHGEGLDEAEHWYDRAQRVMRSHGWELAYDTAAAPDGYAIYSGISPRGLRHSTVGCDGRIVHDPHPSRAGLDSVDGYFTLTRITESHAE